jgi:hypothetical protein
MDELLTLKPKLTRLKLSGVSETLETRISQAMREKWSFSQSLEMLLSDEVERRDFKQLGRRLTRSSLEPDKTLMVGCYDDRQRRKVCRWCCALR